MRTAIAALSLMALLAAAAIAQQTQRTPEQLVEVWKAAVLSGDSAQIAGLAADLSRVQAQVNGKPQPFSAEAQYWASLKQQGLSAYKPEITGVETPQPGVTVISLSSELRWAGRDPKTRYEEEQIAFGSQPSQPPKVLGFARSKLMFMRPLKQLNPHLYEDGADAKKEISEALAQSSKDGKKVILVFGGNWCYDCHVLDAMFHQPDLSPTVERSFRVVHVDIGRGEKNTDIVQKYHVNLDRGVPSLVVLNAKGATIFVDKGGEFEAARSMDPKAVLAFLQKWEKS